MCGQVSLPVLCLTFSLPPLVAQASSPWIEHTSFPQGRYYCRSVAISHIMYQVSQDNVLPMIDRWCDFRFSIGQLPRQLPSKKTQWVRGKRGNPQRTCSSRQQVQNYLWCLGCVGNQRFCEKFSVSLFFSKSLRWWTQKSGKSLLLPPAVDTIENTPARKRTPMLYHHQRCSVENYKNFQT